VTTERTDTMRRTPFRSGWRPAALAAAGLLLLAPAPAFAGGYWYGFKRFWTDFVGDADGVVVVAILVGIVSLLIITRVKGNKG
jgi:hypothetical protein